MNIKTSTSEDILVDLDFGTRFDVEEITSSCTHAIQSFGEIGVFIPVIIGYDCQVNTLPKLCEVV
jgi:hypothetical protein